MKEKCAEETFNKRQLENIISKERQLQHRAKMEIEKVETENAELKAEVHMK